LDVQIPCLVDIVVHVFWFLQLVVVEEVGSLLEGEVIGMTASRAVGIMAVSAVLVETIMEAGVISLVEAEVLLGEVKVISKAEEEEAVPVDQSKMFPHETRWSEFLSAFL
jgi:hypothetical protein